MIACSTVRKQDIRSHYNLATLFYRLFWGRHIHHGLWSASELNADVAATSLVAQQRLTETLALEADIRPGDRVLDVGCGMGSSSIHLASKLNCQVTGVTVSSVQQRWAQCSARWHGVTEATRFLCADAEQLELPKAAFDVVWSIECTEHLFDKASFFQNVAQWLKPGGRLAVCAWLAGSMLDPNSATQVEKVCEGFLCPSLGAKEDYFRWFSDAGLKLVRYHDWTTSVERTWEICRDRVDRSGVRWFARVIDRNSVLFLDRFDTILQAYRSGAMKYGCFIAERVE
ncbi:MAG: class I SAM-dependent methyltransferase [Planctomycetota bacterium]|nr:class I SAM-dependent methyltransferase [Planctomycetota bacterium]